MPLITLIVPFYNEEKHLSRCIASIRKQTFDDYEVLLIDDLSTDGSWSLANGLIQQDSHFRLIKNQQKGLYHARNLALSEARGEYICFLDADDEVLPDYLQGLWEDSRMADSDLVVQGLDHVFSDHFVHARVKTEGCYDTVTQSQSLFAAFDVAELGNVIGKLYKRELILSHALHFYEHVLMSEDLFFVLTYLSVCRKVYLSSRSNYRYIAHNQSMSTRLWPFSIEEMSYLELKKAWEQLLSQYPSSSLSAAYGKFTGNYVHRLLLATQIHPNRQQTYSQDLERLESCYIPLYHDIYRPITLFTRSLKFAATHHHYSFFKILWSMANLRYHIAINYVTR